jgi:F0F1-type ATP synthase assembly protein I
MADLGKFAGLGIQYAATLGIFAFGGFKMDEWLDTKPIFLLLAVFLGFVGGTLSLVKKVSPPAPTKKSPKANSDPKQQ